MSADIGIIIGAAGGGVVLIGIGIFVYCKFCRDDDKPTNQPPAGHPTPGIPHQTATEKNPVSNSGEMTEAQLRSEGWYVRYLQSVTDTLAAINKKYPHARIKVVGVMPDNHAQFGARTRMEFNLLEQDILKALRSGTSLQMEEPEMQRVKLEFLQKEIDEANKDEDATQLIIASCPSQIGKDNTIMEQVKTMVGTGKGHRAATCCFSYEGNVVSTLEKTNDITQNQV